MTALKPSLRRRTLIGLFWSGLGNYGASAVRLLSLLLFGWLLPPNDFGLLALAFMIVVFAEGIGELGLVSALVQQKELGNNDLDSAFWLNLVIHLSLAAVTSMWSVPLTSFLGDSNAAPLLRLLGLVFVINGLAVVPKAILIRKMHFRRISTAQLLGEFGFAMVGLTMAQLGFRVWSLGGAILAQRAVSTVVLWHGVAWRPGRSIDRAAIRRLIRFGGPMMGGTVLERTLVNADYFVIGRFLGTEALGFYSLAYQLAMVPLDRLVGLTRRVTFSAFSIVQNDQRRLTKGALEGLRHLTVVALPIVMSIVILGPWMLQALYGEKWTASINSLRVLGVGGLFLTPRIVEAALLAVGKPSLRLWLLLLRLVVFVILVGSFGLRYGVAGVALCVSAALAVWAFATMALGKRVIGLSWQQVTDAVQPGVRAALGALLPLLLLLVKPTVFLSPWTTLAYAGTTMALIYLALIYPLYKPVLANRLGKNSELHSSNPSMRTESLPEAHNAMTSSVKAAAFALMRILNTLVPEGKFKNRIRAQLLGYRNALPRELMAAKGDTVLQVGMWRQENLLRLAHCVGSSGRIVLIEADPQVATKLNAFAAEQNLDNTTIIAKGASSEKGKKQLRMGTSPTYNRLDDVNVQMMQEEFDSRTEIEVDTVDNILAELEIDHIDYVEITVNGAELKVLRGMTQTLPRTERVFLAGYARTADTGEPVNVQTMSYLKKRGFRVALSRRIPPSRIKSSDRAKESTQALLEGHVFAWRS